MSEDPAVYEARMNMYCDVVIDYLEGLSYREIEAKYNCNSGYIQYALEMTGVSTNRIKSGARLNGYKKRKFSKELKAKWERNAEINKRYKERKRHIHCIFGKQKENNPVLIDDLDIMERMNECDGVDDIGDENLRYHIEITEEGEIRYTNNNS